jgi:hypothetical protein
MSHSEYRNLWKKSVLKLLSMTFVKHKEEKFVLQKNDF